LQANGNFALAGRNPEMQVISQPVAGTGASGGNFVSG
jgi:hypothetical protein